MQPDSMWISLSLSINLLRLVLLLLSSSSVFEPNLLLLLLYIQLRAISTNPRQPSELVKANLASDDSNTNYHQDIISIKTACFVTSVLIVFERQLEYSGILVFWYRIY